ncbi:secondary thiamine-phosphate synthase enzyme YjbQ [Desulfovibrio sp. OttesenSCG-928-A18]|nr:secondary thiamine-phosphate synthase enzyme YjbQ [Desulfovibrio sp. OttesenSCG-928-A18]
MQTLNIRSGQREELIAITGELRGLVREQGWQSGALFVYCPHSTAALTINENADPDVARDMRFFMNRLVPRLPEFRHAEGNSDAHIKTSLFGPHCLLPVEDGEIRLGTWQGVYFCEWDGPRKRSLWVQFLPGI